MDEIHDTMNHTKWMDGSIYVQESYHMDESKFHELKL
jgi:hypothetical protein